MMEKKKDLCTFKMHSKGILGIKGHVYLLKGQEVKNLFFDLPWNLLINSLV